MQGAAALQRREHCLGWCVFLYSSCSFLPLEFRTIKFGVRSEVDGVGAREAHLVVNPELFAEGWLENQLSWVHLAVDANTSPRRWSACPSCSCNVWLCVRVDWTLEVQIHQNTYSPGCGGVLLVLKRSWFGPSLFFAEVQVFDGNWLWCLGSFI